MFSQYFGKLKELMDLVEKTEKENIKAAAKQVANCIQQDGIVRVFGCGHSHMIGEELFYRAGGLAPISPILMEDIMLHKGAVRSSQLEKMNGFADQYMNDVTINPNDVVLVISTSGKNPVPIDVARMAKQKGAFVIAITSNLYAQSQSSRHQEGLYLRDAADIAIDNHILVGDTLMKHGDVSFGSGSTIISMAIANAIIIEAVDTMLTNNIQPPIFKSGNIEGSEQHNKQIVDRYQNRIPML